MEKSHFLGDWWFFMRFLVILLVGTGEPLPYCNKNTLGKIGSKFGIGRPPPPSVGTKDQIFRQIQFEGSNRKTCKSYLNMAFFVSEYIMINKKNMNAPLDSRQSIGMEQHPVSTLASLGKRSRSWEQINFIATRINN